MEKCLTMRAGQTPVQVGAAAAAVPPVRCRPWLPALRHPAALASVLSNTRRSSTFPLPQKYWRKLLQMIEVGRAASLHCKHGLLPWPCPHASGFNPQAARLPCAACMPAMRRRATTLRSFHLGCQPFATQFAPQEGKLDPSFVIT